LVQYIGANPFATDEQLAAHFGVSIATIRLDRQALHIPEARERIRLVAKTRQDDIRALEQQEVIGDVVELQLNRYAVSLLQVEPAHAFFRSGIVRGHVLFGQVNSLAIAAMDAQLAVTARANLRFYRPVLVGELLRARVDILQKHWGVVKCHARTDSGSDVVLEGTIIVVVNPTTVRSADIEKAREIRS